MIRGPALFASCLLVGLVWFWITAEPILSTFIGGIGSGLWLGELMRNETEWEN